MPAPAKPAQSAETQDMLRDLLAFAQKTAADALAYANPGPEVFQPRDAVETMLASLAVAHVRLIHKSAQELLAAPPRTDQTRAKAQLVAMDRMLLGFLRELRLARKRPAETLAASAPAKKDQKPSRQPQDVGTPAQHSAQLSALGPVRTGKAALLSGTASNLFLHPPPTTVQIRQSA